MIPNRFLHPAFLACAILTAASASAQPPKPSTMPNDRDAMTQGFSVVLVLGDLKAGPTVDDNVPAAARKALADMKDFLPYKGYRLLDVQWILGSERSATRLRGVDEQEYQLSLRADRIVGPQGLRVAFHLQEPGAAETTMVSADDGQRRAQLAAMQDRRRQLELELAGMRGKPGEDQRALTESRRQLTSQLAELKRQIEAAEGAVSTARGRSVIDTTFFMDIGETVVVGTSRLGGGAVDNRALIALLTAVPKSGTTKQDD
jgi:hypothetical protein